MPGDDRVSQLIDEAQPVPVVVDLAAIDFIRLRSDLCPVHREVGAAEQTCARRRVDRSARDANAGTNSNTDRVQVERLVELSDQSLGDSGRILRIRVKDEHGEFIATDTHQDVRRPKSGDESRSKLPEQLVAGGMAE